MGIRTVTFAENEFYHIYNRGNSKQIIFKDVPDHNRFQALLFVANGTQPFSFRSAERADIYDFQRGEQLVYIGAYCLMPNHFHILLKPAMENGVQTFMQKLATSYSMYFNKRHDRTGSLFEGKYKSKYVDTDEYLKYLFAYIHLNPVKLSGSTDFQSVLSFLSKYGYSSFGDYVNGASREQAQILSVNPFPEYYKNAEEWTESLSDWIKLEV